MPTKQNLPSNFSFIDNYLAASGFPSTAEQLQALSNLGITHVISLTHDTPENLAKLHKISLSFIHFPTSTLPSLSDIERFLGFMKRKRSGSTKVLLHCQYGIERTGIFLSAYISESEGIPIAEAISRVRTIRPHSLSNLDSEAFLLSNFDKSKK